jgi:hypothetical protein
MNLLLIIGIKVTIVQWTVLAHNEDGIVPKPVQRSLEHIARINRRTS